MGANGDAGQLIIGLAPDFLSAPLAHVGGILQGTRNDLAPRSTSTARLGSRGGDNLALIRVYPSRTGIVHLIRVGREVPVTMNAENLPFSLTVTLGTASMLPLQIASGRTGPLR